MQEEISERTIALGEKGTKFTLEMLEKMMREQDILHRGQCSLIYKVIIINPMRRMRHLVSYVFSFLLF